MADIQVMDITRTAKFVAPVAPAPAGYRAAETNTIWIIESADATAGSRSL